MGLMSQLEAFDPELGAAMAAEAQRQQDHLELIASENYTSVPVMQAQGSDEEQAAIVLGASGWQTFWNVTLPNIKWGLVYGVILCNARAMGEFGAVSVVSGHIRGQTNTMPLHVEILYNEYNSAGAFAAASLLALFALATIGAKNALEWRLRRARESESGQ